MKTTKSLLLLFFFAATITSCDKAASSKKDDSQAKTEVAAENTVAPKATNIVYINNDSLISGYKLYTELSETLKSKQEKIVAELEGKSKSFESRAISFQEKAQKGLITRAQGMETQQKLEAEQQSLLQYRDKVLAEIQEEETVMFNNIWNNVSEYLKEYNAEKQYDLILNQNSATNCILVGNPALDITKEVLEGLNKKYDAEKAATTK